jgi:hypothetical protein
MPAATYELVVLGLGMGAALLMLAIGAWAGYWAGSRVLLAAGGGNVWLDERAQLRAELSQWAERGSLAYGECQIVEDLSQREADRLSGELLEAICRLVQRVSELRSPKSESAVVGSELQDSASLARIGASHPPAVFQPRQFQPHETHPRQLQTPQPNRREQASLTTEQMTDLVGGRKNLGESTLGLESRRYPYQCEQRLATWQQGDPPPTIHDFQTVRCHDIAVDGLSFFWPQEPDFESVIISIGSGDKLIFMHAQISDDKAVCMDHEVAYLVRCRYVRRMDELTAVWHAAGELVGSA